jgi:hypothetical protein
MTAVDVAKFQEVVLYSYTYPIFSGKKFYPTKEILLKNSIVTKGNIFISKDVVGKVGAKEFSKCDNYVDLYQFLNKTLLENRIFYEVIPGNAAQKPHFDIDIKKEYNINPDYVLQVLEDAIKIEMTAKNVNYSFNTNCLVLSSHGLHKYSYHIIIDGYYHTDHKEAKAFYDAVMSHITDHMILDNNIIDPAVYSSFQNFRLLGCQKINSGRYIIVDPMTNLKILHEGDKQKVYDVRLLEKSLITHTADCKALPSWITKEKKIFNVMSTNLVEKYFTKIEVMFEKSAFSKSYEIVDVKDYIISLKRTAPSFCNMHGRSHDSLGGYISLVEQKVRVHCLAQPKMYGTIIGNINCDIIIPNQEDEESDDEGTFSFIDESKTANPKNKMINDGINKDIGNKDEVVSEVIIYNDTCRPPLTFNIKKDNHPLKTVEEVKVGSTNGINKDIGNKDEVVSEVIIYNDTCRPPLTFNIKKDNNPLKNESFLKTLEIEDFKNVSCKLDIKGMILLDEFVDFYLELCRKENYIPKTTSKDQFSKELIQKGVRVDRKQINGVKNRYIIGLRWIVKGEKRNTDLDFSHSSDILKQQTNESFKIKYNNLKINYITAHPIAEKMITTHLPKNDTWTFYLKGPMGGGKSELIISEILKNATLLSACNRITLVNKQVKDFNDAGFQVSHYKEIKTANISMEIEQQLCIQIDSIHRAEGETEYLILDEYTYSISQCIEFSKEKLNNINALVERIKTTKKLILADAFMDSDDVTFINSLRKDVEPFVYENNYPLHNNKKVHLYKKNAKSMFYESLIADLSKGLRIILPCGSKDEVNAIADYVRTRLPHVKIKKYTSDEEIDIDPATEWDQYDLVLYTSVCEAGTSFKPKHFDKCYGYFTNRSCVAESAVQMLFRVRNLTEGDIHLYIDEIRIKEYPDSIETVADIRNYILENDEAQTMVLKHIIGRNVLTRKVTINEHTKAFFDLYCKVEHRKLLSHRNYVDRILMFLKTQGVTCGNLYDVSFMDKEEVEEGKEIVKEIRQLKKENKEIELIEILDADDTWETISKLEKKRELNKTEKQCLMKHVIKNKFPLQLETDTFTWVKSTDNDGFMIDVNLSIIDHYIKHTVSYWNHRNFKEVNDVSDEKMKVMDEIYSRIITHDPTDKEIEEYKISYNHTMQPLKIDEKIKTQKIKDNFIKCCHLIHILRLLNINNISQKEYEDILIKSINIVSIQSYIKTNNIKDIFLLKDDDIKSILPHFTLLGLTLKYYKKYIKVKSIWTIYRGYVVPNEIDWSKFD